MNENPELSRPDPVSDFKKSDFQAPDVIQVGRGFPNELYSILVNAPLLTSNLEKFIAKTPKEREDFYKKLHEAHQIHHGKFNLDKFTISTLFISNALYGISAIHPNILQLSDQIIQTIAVTNLLSVCLLGINDFRDTSQLPKKVFDDFYKTRLYSSGLDTGKKLIYFEEPDKIKSLVLIGLKIGAAVMAAVSTYHYLSSIVDNFDSKSPNALFLESQDYTQPLAITQGFTPNTMLLHTLDGKIFWDDLNKSGSLRGVNNEPFDSYTAPDRRTVELTYVSPDLTRRQLLPLQPLTGQMRGVQIETQNGENVPIEISYDNNMLYYFQLKNHYDEPLIIRTAWDSASDLRQVQLIDKESFHPELFDQLTQDQESRLKDAFLRIYSDILPEGKSIYEYHIAELVGLIRDKWIYSLDFPIYHENSPEEMIRILESKELELYCDTASRLVTMLSEVYDLPTAIRITGGVITSNGIVYSGSLHAQVLDNQSAHDPTPGRIDESSEPTRHYLQQMSKITSSTNENAPQISLENLASFGSPKPWEPAFMKHVQKLKLPEHWQEVTAMISISSISLLGLKEYFRRRGHTNKTINYIDSLIKIQQAFLEKVQGIADQKDTNITFDPKTSVIPLYLNALLSQVYGRDNKPDTSGTYDDVTSLFESIKTFSAAVAGSNRKDTRRLNSRALQSNAWRAVEKVRGTISNQDQLEKNLVDAFIARAAAEMKEIQKIYANSKKGEPTQQTVYYGQGEYDETIEKA